MTKDEICGLLRQIHDVLAMQSETNHWAKPTPAEYAMGYAEGFNDACKPKQGEPVAWSSPQRPWVGLTDEEIQYCENLRNPEAIVEEVEAKLKEKNT
jgi:hypothetical protein